MPLRLSCNVPPSQGFANTSTPIAGQGIDKLSCNQQADFGNVLTMTGTSNDLTNPRYSYDTLGNQCLDTLQEYIAAHNPEGLTIDQWKDKHWSDVLGLEHTSWSSGGFLNGLQCGFTAEPSCRDLARMAQLWNNDGAWAGHGQVMDAQYAMLAMLCYAMLCDAMRCYAMLCYGYAMLCYAMLCYAR